MMDILHLVNRYEIILDCAQQGPEQIKMKGYPHQTYISLNSPVLKNVDQHGLIIGMMKNVGDLLKYNIPDRMNKGYVKWGFFIPSRTGINVLQEFVENGKVYFSSYEFLKLIESILYLFYILLCRLYLLFKKYIPFKICH